MLTFNLAILLFHVVLLIDKNNRSSQPPPALGHLGVTKAHQVPPCPIRWKAKKALRVGSPLPLVLASAKVFFKKGRSHCPIVQSSVGAVSAS